MTARLLPFAEWSRLAGTDLETLWPSLDPREARIVVVEQDGAIIGHHVLLRVLHAECLWIHPSHRGHASVARRLWSAVQAEVTGAGAGGVVTTAIDDTVRALLGHVGAQRLPGDHYFIPITKGSPCRS